MPLTKTNNNKNKIPCICTRRPPVLTPEMCCPHCGMIILNPKSHCMAPHLKALHQLPITQIIKTNYLHIKILHNLAPDSPLQPHLHFNLYCTFLDYQAFLSALI